MRFYCSCTHECDLQLVHIYINKNRSYCIPALGVFIVASFYEKTFTSFTVGIHFKLVHQEKTYVVLYVYI